MSRYLLAAYMLLLSVAGPNVCCCSLARLAGFISSGGQQSHGSGFQLSDCCVLNCCQSPFQDASTDEPSNSERSDGVANEKAPAHHCKCGNLANASDPRPPAEFVIELNRSWVLAIQHMPLSVTMPTTLDSGTPLGLALSDDAPHLSRSGREIRIDLHSWRC